MPYATQEEFDALRVQIEERINRFMEESGDLHRRAEKLLAEAERRERANRGLHHMGSPVMRCCEFHRDGGSRYTDCPLASLESTRWK